MKAAIVTAPGKTPIYAEFEKPAAQPDEELITVRASAMSNLTKGRASGAHYSASGQYPAVAGVDGVGVTQDGRRVYFAMPEPPLGAMAELCVVPSSQCVPIPDSLDDITAAAIANPGMSAWASLVERAHLVAGETVLVNGATGTAGRVSVQLAKHLGAGKVIATGRNAAELEELKQLGADIIIPFSLDPTNPAGAKDFETALKQVFATSIDVVIDYLWGESARTIIAAIAKAAEEGRPVRFVQVGSAGGQESIDLPAAALRSSSIVLMGSGLKSVPLETLLRSIQHVFEAVQPAHLEIATKVVPLADVEETWANASTKPRVVFSIP